MTGDRRFPGERSPPATWQPAGWPLHIVQENKGRCLPAAAARGSGSNVPAPFLSAAPVHSLPCDKPSAIGPASAVAASSPVPATESAHTIPAAAAGQAVVPAAAVSCRHRPRRSQPAEGPCGILFSPPRPSGFPSAAAVGRPCRPAPVPAATVHFRPATSSSHWHILSKYKLSLFTSIIIIFFFDLILSI